MNKFTKITLIALSSFLFVGVLFLPSLVLANGLVDIVFEDEPLFEELNFLPGESIIRWIEIENKSSEIQPIGVEVINYSSCINNCFSEQLNLTINNGLSDLYSFSLDDFFKAGEIKLDDLAVGAKTKYFFSVMFLPESGNQYQEKTVNFDFRIGSLGKESISGEIGTGGSGGSFITGLNIYEETVSNIEETQVKITWKTNKPATSRVVYSSEHQPHTLELDNLPNYGYYYSTAEDSGLKENHEMIITGLTSGTTYYFRCVSRGSLAVSKELVFTTSGVKGEQIALNPFFFGFPLIPEVLGEETTEQEIIEGEESIVSEQIEQELEKMLTSANGLFNARNLCWLFLFAIIILIVLFLLSNKKKENKKKWILPALILIAVILYYIFCCPTCWILVLIAIILFILSLIFNRKEEK